MCGGVRGRERSERESVKRERGGKRIRVKKLGVLIVAEKDTCI